MIEFLLARLAEDEAQVKERFEKYGEEPESWCDRADGLHLSTARVLRDIEAKRAIVEAVPGFLVPHHLIKLLAAVYSDHPDYRAEWKP